MFTDVGTPLRIRLSIKAQPTGPYSVPRQTVPRAVRKTLYIFVLTKQSGLGIVYKIKLKLVEVFR